jgi:hypothetical protein
MTVYTAYEVRVFRNNDWRVEAVLDDEGLAIAAARKIEARMARTPIVVVQEVYDAARNHLKSQSVYRSEPAVRPATPDKKAQKTSGQGAAKKGRDTMSGPSHTVVRSARAVEGAPASSVSSWALFGVLVVALSAYAALRTISG